MPSSVWTLPPLPLQAASLLLAAQKASPAQTVRAHWPPLLARRVPVAAGAPAATGNSVKPCTPGQRRSPPLWRFTRNNGITEELHTRTELVQRQAYGVQNYRLRARVMGS